MLGKTHFAVGIAVSTIYMHPTSLVSLASGMCIGALGSIIPDIDVGTSRSHRELLKIIGLLLLIIGVAVGADVFFNVGLYDAVIRNRDGYVLLLGAICFGFISICGMLTPHRSFMHSLFAMALLSACIYVIYPPVVMYFVAGFLSHVLLDTLNDKKVMLFFPLKRLSFAFRVADSDGKLNWFLFLLGTAFTIWSLFHTSLHILGLIGPNGY